MAEAPADYMKDAPPSAIPTIIGSVGCFIKNQVLIPVKEDNQDRSKVTGWRIAHYMKTTVYDGIKEDLLATKMIGKLSEAPPMSPRCLFKDNLAIASSTGFWVHQDLIIATAGHCIFKAKALDETTCQLKDNFKDWNFVFSLTQEYVDGKQIIPVEKVWGIDRPLFGQNEQFEDMTKSDKGLALDAIDCPDWALVRLLPLTGSKLPVKGPFPLLDSAQLTDGLAKVFTFGHTWGTALKASVPPRANPGIIRTVIKADEQSARSGRSDIRPGRPKKDYTLVNVVRHNVRMGPGNSGSPLLHEDRVVGINASTQGNTLEQRLFTWNGSPGAPIEPYFPPLDDVAFYNNATKCSIWSSLITPGAQILVICRVIDENVTPDDAAKDTRIGISLSFTGPQGKAKPPLTTSGPGSWKSKPYALTLRDGYLSCEISGVTVTYTPPPPPPGPPKHKMPVFIESVQVVSKKVGDTNNLNWTVLLEQAQINRAMVAVQGGASKELSYEVPVAPWLPKEWAEHLAVGRDSIGEIMPDNI